MKKILVAEDNQSELDSIRFTIEKAGYQVIVARNGEDALKYISETKFDLVILDILMPKVSGLQVLESIRQNERTMALPVIMLTNLDTTDETLQQIIRDKPAYYFIKSNIKLEDLVGKINELLQGVSGTQ